MNIIEQQGRIFVEFSNWFFKQPFFAQILTTIGIFAIMCLILIAVYYIIKGIILLIKKIIRKVKKRLERRSDYPLQPASNPYISGNQKKPGNKQSQEIEDSKKKEIIVHYPKRVKYCSECGMKFSDKVKNILNSRGSAFCQYCGKIHRVLEQPIES
jgi:hypothetical protein